MMYVCNSGAGLERICGPWGWDKVRVDEEVWGTSEDDATVPHASLRNPLVGRSGSQRRDNGGKCMAKLGGLSCAITLINQGEGVSWRHLCFSPEFDMVA